jgi:hypothetical protein
MFSDLKYDLRTISSSASSFMTLELSLECKYGTKSDIPGFDWRSRFVTVNDVYLMDMY